MEISLTYIKKKMSGSILNHFKGKRRKLFSCLRLHVLFEDDDIAFLVLHKAKHTTQFKFISGRKCQKSTTFISNPGITRSTKVNLVYMVI